MSVATLAVRDGNNNAANSFSFLVVKSADGFPLDQAMVQEEQLETPGVDGHRWRTVNRQHVQRSFEALSDYDSYDLAVADARKMLKAKGGLGNFILNAGGKAYTFPNTHVLGVSPIVTPGAAVGGSAGASSAATIRSTWTVEFTNFAPSASQ